MKRGNLDNLTLAGEFLDALFSLNKMLSFEVSELFGFSLETDPGFLGAPGVTFDGGKSICLDIFSEETGFESDDFLSLTLFTKRAIHLYEV